MTDTDTTIDEVATTTIEMPWGTWVRICRHVPEDEVNFAERAPRERALSGEADNLVPAHEGTVLALVDAHDFNRKHVRYLRREGGEWIARTWDEVIDAYDPAGIPRRADKLAHYLAHKDDWKYRVRRVSWEGAVVGLHVNKDGSGYVVEWATKKLAWLRQARPEEIAAGAPAA